MRNGYIPIGPRLTNDQLDMVGRRNFENWFYLHEEIARVIYKKGDWISLPEIRLKIQTVGNLSKILRRGAEDGALEQTANIRPRRWILTVEGKEFFKRMWREI